jgi:hypothetical protein
MFYPHATRRPAIDAPKVAALLSRFAGTATLAGTNRATAHSGENGLAKWAIKRLAEPVWLLASNGPEDRTARSRGDIAGAA